MTRRDSEWKTWGRGDRRVICGECERRAGLSVERALFLETAVINEYRYYSESANGTLWPCLIHLSYSGAFKGDFEEQLPVQ